MRKRRLGMDGPEVSSIALGCMGMSDGYGPTDRETAIATIHAALDAGVTLFDTADYYGAGHNELLIGEALRGIPRGCYQMSVKFGSQRDPAGGWGPMDGRPDAVRNYLAYSLRRLNLEHIEVYRLARLDPTVPIEDTVGALTDCVAKGWISHVALSEVGIKTIRRAAAVHRIADVQIEYSLLSRGIEDAILPACRELGIGVTAYGVLSRGLLSGSRPNGDRDFRAISPRFQGDNLIANAVLAERLRAVAEARRLTATQIAIAWVLAQGEDIVPLVGARRPDQVAEALGAAAHDLTEADLAAIEGAVPENSARGSRYPEAMLARLDSER